MDRDKGCQIPGIFIFNVFVKFQEFLFLMSLSFFCDSTLQGFFFFIFYSAIRELTAQALENLTPRMPDYFCETGKKKYISFCS